MLKIIILDYSILGQHSRESALFSKKFPRQLTLLGHAGSPCFLSFCYLRCRVLTCSILGSVYLKTIVNLQKYIHQSCSMPENSINLQKYSNQCCSILGSVYLKSTVDLQKRSNQCCSILGSVYLKSTVYLQKYSNHSCSILGSVYLKSTVNLQKYSNQCCSIPANVYLKNT